jgi:hypothetical protein
MAFRSIPLAVLVPLLLLAGCRRESVEPVSHEEGAKLPQADAPPSEPRSRFVPPADGVLSERQVEMLAAVERREREIRLRAAAEAVPTEVAKADLSSAVRALERGGDAEGSAIHELGLDPGEVVWVKARASEARMAIADRTLERRMGTGRAQYLALLEARLRRAEDPVLRVDLQEQIADFRRRTWRAAPRLPPAVEKNAALLEKVRERLADLQVPGAPR